MDLKSGKLFPIPTLLLGVALLDLAFQASSAWAGVFSVTPVRIYMTPKDRAVAVTLSNEGDSPIVLQADIYAWTQKADGTDNMVLTDDLLLSPPIIKLAPRAHQVVRLAMLAPRDASRQMTYRMIMREVPEAVQPKNSIEVPITLALNMPIFITPPTAKREVNCGVNRADAHTLQAVCSNTGTAYAQIREVVLKRGGQQLASFEGGNYILPGARKAIKLRTLQQAGPGEVEMSVTFDDFQSQTSMVPLP
jgi:fimbrial chaperone protein